jgi:hypothetical protein
LRTIYKQMDEVIGEVHYFEIINQVLQYTASWLYAFSS